MEIFRLGAGAYGAYHFGRHGLDKYHTIQEQNQLLDQMTRDVWQAIRPDQEMTDEALFELRSMILSRPYDYVNQGTYTEIDQALVDLGYANSVETAASENAFEDATDVIGDNVFGVAGDVAIAALFALVSYVGLRQKAQAPWNW